MLQETISQGIYHTHTIGLLCIPWLKTLLSSIQLALEDSNHLGDGTPLQKRISIEPQITFNYKIKKRKEKQKTKEKKNVKKLLVNRISGIIQSESWAKSEGPFKA